MNKGGQENKRFPAADGIRGLAVLIVLMAHALVMFIPASRPYLGGTGKIGVWLFFVLSAFLLSAKFIKTGINARSLTEYALGRAIRILPMFFIASIFYFAVGYYDYHHLIKIITFREGYGHLWTIPVEFKFYFLLPVFSFLFCTMYRLKGILLLMLAAALIIISFRLVFPADSIPENSIYTRWYVSSFVLGMVLAYTLLCARPVKEWLGRMSGVIMLLALAGIVLIIPAIPEKIIGKPLISNLPTSYFSLSIFWSIFIYFSFYDKGFFKAILTSNLMRDIGNHSFSTYLFHWFVLTELSARYSGSITCMIAGIIISLIAGKIIYICIERNIETARHSLQKFIFSPSR